jgi:hypothetical protein
VDIDPVHYKNFLDFSPLPPLLLLLYLIRRTGMSTAPAPAVSVAALPTQTPSASTASTPTAKPPASASTVSSDESSAKGTPAPPKKRGRPPKRKDSDTAAIEPASSKDSDSKRKQQKTTHTASADKGSAAGTSAAASDTTTMRLPLVPPPPPKAKKPAVAGASKPAAAVSSTKNRSESLTTTSWQGRRALSLSDQMLNGMCVFFETPGGTRYVAPACSVCMKIQPHGRMINFYPVCQGCLDDSFSDCPQCSASDSFGPDLDRRNSHGRKCLACDWGPKPLHCVKCQEEVVSGVITAGMTMCSSCHNDLYDPS